MALHDFLDSEAASSTLTQLAALKDVLKSTMDKPGAGPGLEHSQMHQSYGAPAVRDIYQLSLVLKRYVALQILAVASCVDGLFCV
jgi:hypothetical protein